MKANVKVCKRFVQYLLEEKLITSSYSAKSARQCKTHRIYLQNTGFSPPTSCLFDADARGP